MHPTNHVGEGDALVDPILKERHCPIPRIIKYAQPSDNVLTLTPIPKHSPRLLPLLVNIDNFLRPHVPVNTIRGVFPKS